MKPTSLPSTNLAPELDRLEVAVDLIAQEAPLHLVRSRIRINGEALGEPFVVNLEQLVKSCQLGGHFFFLTCECGVEGCAGIDEAFLVTHTAEFVEWQVPDPVSWRGVPAAEIDHWHNHPLYTNYRFDAKAYTNAISQALHTAQAYAAARQGDIECTPYGCHVETLVQLDPVVFNQTPPTPGFRILGRSIWVEHEPVGFWVNGLHYRLSELPLPGEIAALDDWSDWTPKPVGKHGFVYGSLAAPKSEVRRRVRLLAEYLALISPSSATVEYCHRQPNGRQGPMHRVPKRREAQK